MADDVPNRGPSLLGVNYFFAVLAFLTVVIRSYVRIFIMKRFSFDDGVMLVAMVLFETYCAMSISGVYSGTGRHHADLEEHQIERAMGYWWFCYLFYAMTMMVSKISIAIFLLRIVFERVHKWTLYAAMAVSVIAGLAFFFVTLFQCSPVSYFWIRSQDGQCLDPYIVVVLAIVYSVLAIISDLTFVILPVFLLWNLRMDRRTKIALVPLLSMGCIASAAVVVRFPYLLKLNSDDFLWDTVGTAIWSTVEQGLAISAGSLATTRPLIRTIGERLGWVTRTSAATTPTPGILGSPAYALNDGPRSSSVRNKSIYDPQKELPLTPDERARGNPYRCDISANCDGDGPPGSRDGHIVVTTHRVQSVRQKPHRSESEEYLAGTDGDSSRQGSGHTA